MNKSKFIRFLIGHLSGHGYVVSQSSNDADTFIVEHALQSAKSGNPTVVVADDTDIIVLLMHQYQMNTMEDVFFQSEATRRSKSGLRIISTRKAVSNYDAEMLFNLPFLYAWGVDVTLYLQFLGKVNVKSSSISLALQKYMLRV